MSLEVTSVNFEKEVLNSEIPVLVDFWAPWCGPCKAIAPVIEEVEKEVSQQIKVCKVNIDDSPEIATRYSIMSIPTLMILKQGNIMEMKVGAVRKEELMSLIQKHL